ncbi:MAG: class I SAM-dependent methyltransferase [Candidatus Omnitrophota bacterium]|nr:class I SAM-dependent methyltransferase [Candidatus Omnitrophota bacterium]
MNEKCRYCGSDKVVFIAECREPVANEEHERGQPSDTGFVPGQLLRCPECHLGMRCPAPSDGELKNINNFSDLEKYNYGCTGHNAQQMARKLLIKQFSPDADISVLDIGCFKGDFLASLPGKWKRFGIEPNESMGEIFAEGNIKVIGSHLEDNYSLWKEYFDVITMFDVFEHLSNPGAGIRNALELLKAGGVLILCTGNMDACSWRLLKGQYYYLDDMRHISFASVRFFKRFFREEGIKHYSIRKISHQPSGTFERIHDSVVAFYFFCRFNRGFWRIPHRVIQSLPGFRRLRHSKNAPYLYALKDHLFVEILKTELA